MKPRLTAPTVRLWVPKATLFPSLTWPFKLTRRFKNPGLTQWSQQPARGWARSLLGSHESTVGSRRRLVLAGGLTPLFS